MQNVCIFFFCLCQCIALPPGNLYPLSCGVPSSTSSAFLPLPASSYLSVLHHQSIHEYLAVLSLFLGECDSYCTLSVRPDLLSDSRIYFTHSLSPPAILLHSSMASSPPMLARQVYVRARECFKVFLLFIFICLVYFSHTHTHSRPFFNMLVCSYPAMHTFLWFEWILSSLFVSQCPCWSIYAQPCFTQMKRWRLQSCMCGSNCLGLLGAQQPSCCQLPSGTGCVSCCCGPWLMPAPHSSSITALVRKYQSVYYLRWPE